MKPFFQSTAALAAAPSGGGAVAARFCGTSSSSCGARLWAAVGGSSSSSSSSTLTCSAPRVTTGATCFCRGLPAVSGPLQMRRGAAQSRSGRPRRSPTVRRAEHMENKVQQQQQQQPQKKEHAGRATPFAELDALRPALAAGIEALDSALTEDECIDILAASKRLPLGGTPLSEAVLARDYDLTPYQLHSVAVLLLYGGSGAANASACHAAAMMLLHQAASTGTAGGSGTRPGGYLPSTLTIINMFGVDRTAAGGGLGGAAVPPEQRSRMRQSRVYQNAERQFKAYLSAHSSVKPATADDRAMQANAFTLAGVVAESAGDAARALRWYKAARDVGSRSVEGGGEASNADGVDGADVAPRPPRWSWEMRCLEAIGRLEVALADGGGVRADGGRQDEARRALRTAALALGSGEAGLLLATRFADAEPEHAAEMEVLLQRAAVGAVPGAAAALAERAAHKAATAAPKEAAYERQLADEWRQIAAASVAADSAAASEFA